MFGLNRKPQNQQPALSPEREKELKEKANLFADQRDYVAYMALSLQKTMLQSGIKTAPGFSPSAFFRSNDPAIKEFIREQVEKSDARGDGGYVKFLDRLFSEYGAEYSATGQMKCERNAEAEKAVKLMAPTFETLCLSLANDGLSPEQYQGITKALEQVKTAIEEMGGKVINPAIAEKFDPSEHEAVRTVSHDSLTKGTIASVQRPGFKFEGKLLSPALVTVAA